MVLAMAEHRIWTLARRVSSTSTREAWKAALFDVPEDLREAVNQKALEMFHRKRGTILDK